MNLKKLLTAVFVAIMCVAVMSVSALADGNEAKIGETEYPTIAAAIEAADSGEITILTTEIDIETEKALTFNAPADATVHIVAPKATLKAGGDLTFTGENEVSAFGAGSSNRTITIGEGASLAVTGTGRVTIGYGNVFNITGDIENAKTADVSEMTPSFYVPAGLSITGGSGATFNVENAYVKFDKAVSSKDTDADGTFNLSFENCVADFGNNFSFPVSKNSHTPVFNIDFVDSVMNFNSNLDFNNVGCNVTIDNSDVSVKSSMRNVGELEIINGSDLIIKSHINNTEHGGNSGTITVDNSSLDITCTNGVVSGAGTGEIVLKNGAVADIELITDSTVKIEDATVEFAGKVVDTESVTFETPDELDIVVDENGVIEVKLVAVKIGDAPYYSLDEALDDAIANNLSEIEIEVLNDIAFSSKLSNFKKVTFTGTNREQTVDLNINSSFESNVALEFNDLTVSRLDKEWLYHYFYAKGGLTFNDCKMIGLYVVTAQDTEFTDCDFYNDDSFGNGSYSIWLYNCFDGVEVNITDCTFDVYERAIKMYGDGYRGNMVLNITETDFVSRTADKTVVEMAYANATGVGAMDLNISEDSTAEGFGAPEHIDGKDNAWFNVELESGKSTLSTVTIGEEIVYDDCVAKIGEVKFASLQAALEAAEDGDVINLMAGEIVLDDMLVVKDSVTIKSATTNARSTANATTIVVTGTTGYVVASAENGVTFENIDFVAAEDFAGEYWMTGSGMNCVANSSVLCALGRVNVNNCSFENNGNATTAVWLAGDSTGKFGKAGINAANSSVINSEFTGFPRGVEMQGDNIPCGNTVVTGNTFTEVDSPLNMYWGVNADNSAVTFTGNTIVSALTEDKAPTIALWDYSFEKGNDNHEVEFTITGNNAPEDTEFVITNTVTENITTNEEIIRNYSNPAYAEECAADGEEFYLYYDRDYRTEAEKTADGIEYTKIAEGTKMVAFIDGVYYDTLQKAFAAAKDGDEILVLGNVTINTGINNGGDWYEGVYYQGDKSFTVNLNEYTVTNTDAVNDYLFLIKNDGAKANEITFKNGTFNAAAPAYCALCTSTTSTQQITINLENVNLIGNNSNGSVVKIRGGAVLNVYDGTVITGEDSYLGIENSASTVNIYDGAKIYMNGTTSYNGCLVGVGGNGTVNVYGGYGKGVAGGFIAMTSGGTINVSGGEWIADIDGAVSGNDFVLIAQNDKTTYPDAGESVINVSGGTFTGGYNCYGGAAGDSQLNISGGTFSVDPTAYLVNGFVPVTTADGKYAVADEANVLDTIKVEFVKVDAENPEEELLYNINLTAYDGEVINRLNSGDLTFVLTKDENDYGANKYEIIDIPNDDITVNPVDNNGRYEFHFSTKTDVENDTNKTITIAQVKFTGYGKFSFSVAQADTNAVHATQIKDSIVDTFVPNPDTAKNEGTLDVSAALKELEIKTPTRKLTINVDFPNSVENKETTYQQMKVVISGDDLAEALVIDLGEECAISAYANAEKPYAAVSADFVDGAYVIEVSGLLIKGNTYFVEVSGAGYRTANHTVQMTTEKTLNFWNNVKDAEKAIEVYEAEGQTVESGKTKVTFLAGDIVHDGLINIYDLSAVVSYFGEEDLAKYDLNRDGKIDSKDVAYVLVSWGN